MPISYRTKRSKVASSDLSDCLNSSEDLYNSESDSMGDKTKMSTREKLMKFIQQKRQASSNLHNNENTAMPSNFTEGLKIEAHFKESNGK